MLPSRARDQQIVPWRDHFCFRQDGQADIMIDPPDPSDYSVAVKRNRKPRDSWRWEISRAGKSLPVERSPDRFQTVAEATRAAKEALQRLVKLRLSVFFRER